MKVKVEIETFLKCPYRETFERCTHPERKRIGYTALCDDNKVHWFTEFPPYCPLLKNEVKDDDKH